MTQVCFENMSDTSSEETEQEEERMKRDRERNDYYSRHCKNG